MKTTAALCLVLSLPDVFIAAVLFQLTIFVTPTLARTKVNVRSMVQQGKLLLTVIKNKDLFTFLFSIIFYVHNCNFEN